MKLFEQVRLAKCPPVPKGWSTIAALARHEGVASPSGSFVYQVKAAVEHGILERKLFRVPRANGIRRVAHYRYTRNSRA